MVKGRNNPGARACAVLLRGSPGVSPQVSACNDSEDQRVTHHYFEDLLYKVGEIGVATTADEFTGGQI